MLALQRAGVPAGVCQTAADRCDHDPQLAALEWLTEVTGTKIGRWPIAEVPVKLSESPAYIGGRIDRGAPCYGEDNEYVYGELLGMSSQEIKALAEDGVIPPDAATIRAAPIWSPWRTRMNKVVASPEQAVADIPTGPRLPSPVSASRTASPTSLISPCATRGRRI